MTDLDLEQLEKDISETLKRQPIKPLTLPPAPQLPLPQVLLQSEPDVGKLSAEAVLEQYKLAAKSIEDMGNEVQARVRALETALNECHEDMKLLKEAAEAVREKGKQAQTEIERTSAVSKDIREIVRSIKAKLA